MSYWDGEQKPILPTCYQTTMFLSVVQYSPEALSFEVHDTTGVFCDSAVVSKLYVIFPTSGEG